MTQVTRQAHFRKRWLGTVPKRPRAPGGDSLELHSVAVHEKTQGNLVVYVWGLVLFFVFVTIRRSSFPCAIERTLGHSYSFRKRPGCVTWVSLVTATQQRASRTPV